MRPHEESSLGPSIDARLEPAIAAALAALATLASLSGCGARTALDEPRAAMRDAGARLEAGLDARAPLDAPGLDALDARALDAPAHETGLDAPGARDAPPDARPPDAGDPCETDPGPLRAPICTRPLFADDAVLSCPGGFVDVVAQGPGTLAWECGGGRAEARFGDRIYRGSRTGDAVALCIQTEFDYADGCRWRSSQRLEGDVATGELRLTYREVAIAGTACFPPCSADARVVVR